MARKRNTVSVLCPKRRRTRSSVGPKVVSKVRRSSREAYGSRAEWEAIKRKVKSRDGHQCRLCKSTEFLQVDHIIQVSKGGQSVMHNLWTLCDICHSKRPGHKSAKSLILHKRKSKNK